jgi:hypothetical protein
MRIYSFFQVGQNGIGNVYVGRRLEIRWGKQCWNDLFLLFQKIGFRWNQTIRDPLLPQPLFGCRNQIAGWEEPVSSNYSVF